MHISRMIIYITYGYVRLLSVKRGASRRSGQPPERQDDVQGLDGRILTHPGGQGRGSGGRKGGMGGKGGRGGREGGREGGPWPPSSPPAQTIPIEPLDERPAVQRAAAGLRGRPAAAAGHARRPTQPTARPARVVAVAPHNPPTAAAQPPPTAGARAPGERAPPKPD